MPFYTAKIYNHSGKVKKGRTYCVDEIKEESFFCDNDQRAFEEVYRRLHGRVFNPKTKLPVNPTDGRNIQRLEELIENENIIVDCSEFRLENGLKRDSQGRIFAEKKKEFY